MNRKGNDLGDSSCCVYRGDSHGLDSDQGTEKKLQGIYPVIGEQT